MYPCHPESEFPSAYYPETNDRISVPRKKQEKERYYSEYVRSRYAKTDTSEEVYTTEGDFMTEEQGYKLDSSYDSREYSRYVESESSERRRKHNKKGRSRY